MRIRSATPEDCREIAQVHVLSWQQAYEHMLPQAYLSALSVEQREAMWRASFRNAAPQLLVARDADESIAGFIAFGPPQDKKMPEHCAEIWALYLDARYWSQGIGRRLWLATLERLLAQGVTTITLWVMTDNERARRFYQAAGFKPQYDTYQNFTLGGVQLEEMRYVWCRDDQ